MDINAATSMMKKHIREIESVSDSDFNVLAALFSFKTVKKKEYFTKQNEVCKSFAYVTSGCMRAFNIDGKGGGYTMYFAFTEWWIGDKKFIAKAGDEIFFPRHTPHAFQNIGSKAGKTLRTVVPGGNFEEFFDKIGSLPPGEPNMEQVAAIFAAYGMKVLVGSPAN